MARERRSFTPEYKHEAVRLLVESGRPVREVAKQLGIRLGPVLLRPIEPEQNVGQDYQAALAAPPGHGEYESAGEQLRQRRRRELLLDVEAGADRAAALAGSSGAHRRAGSIHRWLVQPLSTALPAGIPQPSGLRTRAAFRRVTRVNETGAMPLAGALNDTNPFAADSLSHSVRPDWLKN